MSKTRREIKTPGNLRDFHVGTSSLVGLRKPGHTHKRKVKESRLAHGRSIFSKQPDAKSIVAQLGITDMTPANYIRSALDNEALVKIKPVNVLNGICAQGLYAAKFIPSGTCIGEYTGKRYSEDEFQKHLKKDKRANSYYALSVEDDILDSANHGNYTRYINFSEANENVEFLQSTRNNHHTVRVVTTRDVQKGEQFLVDYNVHDEKTANEYFFVNPSDNDKSTYEIYEANRTVYTVFTVKKSYPLFKIKTNDDICLSKIAKAILNGESLADKYEKPDASIVNLPCMQMDSSASLYEFNQKDTISALMLACYLGQFDNVAWLIRCGARVNQQQNGSGVYPLMCALAGYELAEARLKPLYYSIIKSLVQTGASTVIHDRSEIAFVHQARVILSADHFLNLLACIKSNRPREFKKLLQYVDDGGDDIITASLRTQNFAQFTALLKIFPDYLQEQSNEDANSNIEAIKSAIENFNAAAKDKVIKCIAAAGIETDQHTLVVLGLISNKRKLRR